MYLDETLGDRLVVNNSTRLADIVVTFLRRDNVISSGTYLTKVPAIHVLFPTFMVEISEYPNPHNTMSCHRIPPNNSKQSSNVHSQHG